jgi:hypothetical protein
MLIFLLAQLPFPVILFLNLQVTRKFLRVRKLSRDAAVEKPLRLAIGWWLNNLAIIFFLIPPITEQRFFVQDHRWLLSYAVSAALTIIGLMLMNNALGEELRELERTARQKSRK